MRHSGLVRAHELLAVLSAYIAVVVFGFTLAAAAQPPAPAGPVYVTPSAQYGPYNGIFLPDGLGLSIPIPNAKDTLLDADTPWTMLCWINIPEPIGAPEIVASLGSLSAEYGRFLRIEPGTLAFSLGKGNDISGPADLTPNVWHLLATSFDGKRFSLYVDGKPVADGMLTLGSTNGLVMMAPIFAGSGMQHFGGRIANFTLMRRTLRTDEIAAAYRAPPDFAAIIFEEGSKPWAIQTRGQAGYRAPQDPATMPQQRGSFSAPVAIQRPPVGTALTQLDANDWSFNDGWTMIEAPKLPIEADGARISQASFAASGWMRATVPGTVLTTLVDDGIYPDPYYGLNNLAIPESLNKQDYWYRNAFDLPAALAGQQLMLDFEGINYHASIWLNGARMGEITGAFQRGQFDVSAQLKAGRNVLAVRISPPPHPGIPQEQSILGGPGENGGMLALDGPTFVATEGWDWIPAIRDRDSGIWQPVSLRVTRRLKLGDAQVVTTFPGHDTSTAKIDLSIPVTNLSGKPIQGTINATIESIAVHKAVTLPPGETVVKLTSAEFPQLLMQHPRLWWPNGYGKPDLYHLLVNVADGEAKSDARISDAKDIRFGVREVSYELSLFDGAGHLRRVEYTPANGDVASHAIVNVGHDGMREAAAPDAVALNVPEAMRDHYHTFVSSFAPAAAASSTIAPSTDLDTSPYLVIKVNGVRIAARGGNWGMDDARKRVSRERLEPFFRLNRDANLNIIRNWVGQSTEETFYELADEYGMMVWNDFWESTENYNIEAEDPALFLANAADTIRRFRNHPSIVVWCGRNEGVPQPIISDGLDSLVRTLDGTRYYSPSSNALNLAGSGPYRYQPPALYFTTLNRGFSVETGTPSMSTLESFESTTPKEDRWPIDDVWAYHDWHHAGNGDTAPFMAEIQAEFGAPTSLEDFERKAQMLNYVDHRAIFEGMDANLWSPNSGRLLWMTQPAWPSTMWQILSSDYDTQASYYGVKEACEPVHVQLNLATNQVQVVNTTTELHKDLTVSARVYLLSNELLTQASETKDVAADSTTGSMKLELSPLLARGMLLVALELKDSEGKLVSQNLYWLGSKPEAYRELTRLPATPIRLTAISTRSGDAVHIEVKMVNTGSVVSLQNKLTLLTAADGSRILPAYFSDNYVSLLPGETRTVTIEYPASVTKGPANIALLGWNSVQQTIRVQP
jgi:hypothetical protein